MKINWLTKLLIHFSPRSFFRLAARENKLDYKKIEEAENLFRDTKRIDFFPSGGTGGRSLIIVIDNKLSLFFYQNEDTFTYDGFEIGPYKNGEVTVFDKIK